LKERGISGNLIAGKLITLRGPITGAVETDIPVRKIVEEAREGREYGGELIGLHGFMHLSFCFLQERQDPLVDGGSLANRRSILPLRRIKSVDIGVGGKELVGVPEW